MKQSEIDWFRPLWRRVVVTLVCVVWGASELIFSRDPLWIGLAGVALGYCVWKLFLTFPKDAPKETAMAPPAEPPTQP